MATTREELDAWFDRGVQNGDKYMVVIVDTFDWEDYPVFCKTEDEARKRMRSPGEMQKVMEVYDLSGDKEEQLSLSRCFALKNEASSSPSP